MDDQARVGNLLFFALKFFVFVGVLVVAWWLLLPYYGYLLVQVAGGILQQGFGMPILAGRLVPAGILNTDSMLVFDLEDRSPALPIALLVTNVPPYLALVLATIGLGLWRRLRVALYGVAILVAGHVLFIVFALRFQETVQQASEIPTAIMQFYLTLPFLLWIVFAYWDRLGAYLRESAEDE